MQLETHSNLLTEVTVQHLPTIRWFKNSWMDVVFETDAKGQCVEFSISHRQADEDFNIEWNGNQIFFLPNSVDLDQKEDTVKKALFLIKEYGGQIPPDMMEFLNNRLTSFLAA